MKLISCLLKFLLHYSIFYSPSLFIVGKNESITDYMHKWTSYIIFSEPLRLNFLSLLRIYQMAERIFMKCVFMRKNSVEVHSLDRLIKTLMHCYKGNLSGVYIYHECIWLIVPA